MAGIPLTGAALIGAGVGAGLAGATFMVCGATRIGRAARPGGVAALFIGSARIGMGLEALGDGGGRLGGV